MQSLLKTVSTGFHNNDKPTITEETCNKITQSLLETISTGFHHDDKPVIAEETNREIRFKESIKDTVDTGYGTSGTEHKKCPDASYVQYLEKD